MGRPISWSEGMLRQARGMREGVLRSMSMVVDDLFSARAIGILPTTGRLNLRHEEAAVPMMEDTEHRVVHATGEMVEYDHSTWVLGLHRVDKPSKRDGTRTGRLRRSVRFADPITLKSSEALAEEDTDSDEEINEEEVEEIVSVGMESGDESDGASEEREEQNSAEPISRTNMVKEHHATERRASRMRNPYSRPRRTASEFVPGPDPSERRLDDNPTGMYSMGVLAPRIFEDGPEREEWMSYHREPDDSDSEDEGVVEVAETVRVVAGAIMVDVGTQTSAQTSRESSPIAPPPAASVDPYEMLWCLDDSYQTTSDDDSSDFEDGSLSALYQRALTSETVEPPHEFGHAWEKTRQEIPLTPRRPLPPPPRQSETLLNVLSAEIDDMLDIPILLQSLGEMSPAINFSARIADVSEIPTLPQPFVEVEHHGLPASTFRDHRVSVRSPPPMERATGGPQNSRQELPHRPSAAAVRLSGSQHLGTSTSTPRVRATVSPPQDPRTPDNWASNLYRRYSRRRPNRQHRNTGVNY